jgi:hypothetical protein
MTTTQLPQCVLQAVLPEKAPRPVVVADGSKAGNIDRYVEGLPEQKRWVVDLVETLSSWYRVDPKLILSIITAESNF